MYPYLHIRVYFLRYLIVDIYCNKHYLNAFKLPRNGTSPAPAVTVIVQDQYLDECEFRKSIVRWSS